MDKNLEFADVFVANDRTADVDKLLDVFCSSMYGREMTDLERVKFVVNPMMRDFVEGVVGTWFNLKLGGVTCAKLKLDSRTRFSPNVNVDLGKPAYISTWSAVAEIPPPVDYADFSLSVCAVVPREPGDADVKLTVINAGEVFVFKVASVDVVHVDLLMDFLNVNACLQRGFAIKLKLVNANVDDYVANLSEYTDITGWTPVETLFTYAGVKYTAFKSPWGREVFALLNGKRVEDPRVVACAVHYVNALSRRLATVEGGNMLEEDVLERSEVDYIDAEFLLMSGDGKVRREDAVFFKNGDDWVLVSANLNDDLHDEISSEVRRRVNALRQLSQ